MSNKRDLGGSYEALAAARMENEGMQILEMNYRCRIGEIDIVARDSDGTFVFTEVKFRNTDRFGLPEEAVFVAKQQKIRRTAQYFLMQRNLPDTVACRFDVAAIDGSGRMTYYRDAFGGI